MFMPRRPPKGFRKPHHPSRDGMAKGGTRVSFGEYGIQALEPAYVTNRQIEAARIAMNRHIRRGGKVWITIFPDRAITKKPAETRMGSGKGSPEWWVANVKPGRILFEMSFPNEPTARVQGGDVQPPRPSRDRPAGQPRSAPGDSPGHRPDLHRHA